MSARPQPDLEPPPSAPATSRRYQSTGYRAKKLLLGPAPKTSQLVHERVSKRVALAVFSSDPISSTAYTTEEILLVLVGASLAGGVLALLVVSYRQVVDAYPSAGGAYVVSRDNLGNVTAAVAGAALLIDYVLTVAVSVSSGVAAMASVYPDQLGPIRVEISVAFVLLLAWGNLLGIREAGRIFAIPTYVYVVSVGAMIVAGIWRKVHLLFPLELVDAPDRNPLATVEEAVAERVRPDTEVSVLVPRRRYVGFWRRVPHDQTSAGLTRVLGSMENVNVTLVPFHLGNQPKPFSVKET